MTVADRRRVSGPEVSVQPIICPSLALSTAILSASQQRSDSRFPEQLRPLIIHPQAIPSAQGSCLVELGATKLVCSVYGPRAAARAKDFCQPTGTLSVDVEHAPFSFAAPTSRAQYGHVPEDQELAALLKDALSPAILANTFPNASVDVYVTVLEDDGSVLSAAITAASVAMILAGIECVDSVVAFDAVVDSSSGIILADPTAHESKGSGSRMTVAWMPNIGEATAMNQSGLVEPAVFQEVLAMAVDAANAVYHSIILPVFSASQA